jgi:multidrug efflux pump subunit AcrA (membrane-fusion protein)
MFPVSPFAGVIDKIFVHVGDNITSGTTLASISGNNQHAEIVVSVPSDIAKNISIIEPSVLSIGDQTIEMVPSYISKDATDGVLYSVIYQLDDSLTTKLTDSTYVNVQIPIGVANTTNIDPFIPLDSVVQTQEESFVYVVDNKNIARVKKISLGQIQGRFVEVLSGLPKESEVILDRSVIEGDKVKAIR